MSDVESMLDKYHRMNGVDMVVKVMTPDTTVPIKVMCNSPKDFRFAKYPDGSRRLQGAFEWYKGKETGVEWKDIPEVSVNESGEAITDELD